MDDPSTEPLALAEQAIGWLKSVEADAWVEGGVPGNAAMLRTLRALRDVVDERVGWLETVLIDSMEDDEVGVRGVGRVVRRKVPRTTWINKASGENMRRDLRNAVAADIALDIETGEIDERKRNIALATMTAAYEAIPAFSDVKKSGLFRFRLNMDDYRHTDYGYRIEIEDLL